MNNKWKADEMELSINFKAMRLSWVFVGVALTLWCIVKYIMEGEFPSVPFILLMTQNIIFFSAKLLIARRLTKNNSKADQEDEE